MFINPKIWFIKKSEIQNIKKWKKGENKRKFTGPYKRPLRELQKSIAQVGQSGLYVRVARRRMLLK